MLQLANAKLCDFASPIATRMCQFAGPFATALNDQLKDIEPWKVVAATASVTIATTYFYSQLRVAPIERGKKAFFALVQKFPPIRKRIESEMMKMKKNFEKEVLKPTETIPDLLELPRLGWDKSKVLEQTRLYLKQGEFNWQEGMCSGMVYNNNNEIIEIMTEVYGLAAFTNPLHADAFPGIRKMETEVVRMTCNMFNGGPDSCGCVTTGGSESIILACKAYRDYAREVRGISEPEMLIPVTAHAAFDKGAALLGMRVKHVPVDEVTKRVRVDKMKRMIGRNTAMLVGSAPQFPHGSIDDIEEIAALGLKYNIPVHVDACLGGFLIAFMEEAGFTMKPFDFRVKGVTSISADTHKYGFAPKGTSVIMYSAPQYRHYQWFTCPDWPGGIYATTTIGGSRSGGIIAACWATMTYFGRDRYVETTRQIVETTRNIARKLRAIRGIYTVGMADVSVVAFSSSIFIFLAWVTG